MINTNIPFPQANDFEKIISLINIEDESKLKEIPRISAILGGVEPRQVDYYINAIKYLGIINENKEFTSLGNKIRLLFGIEQEAEISRIVVTDEIFGRVYFLTKMLGNEISKEDVVLIMKKCSPNMGSDAVYKRRASTVTAWVNWIISKEL